MLLLAGLPLLARRFFGPPDNRAARRLRGGCYAAILALMQARTKDELFLGARATQGRGAPTYTMSVTQCPNAVHVANCLVPGTLNRRSPPRRRRCCLLLLTACGPGRLLTLTARRIRVARAALAIGACAGLGLGAAMYAVDPLGVQQVS